MARRRDPKKALDEAIEREWYRQASGVQVSVLDIPKIFADVRAAVGGGTPLEEAVGAAVARYRVN